MISLFRKTFLILSGVGCSLATLAFAGIFWKIDNPGHVVKCFFAMIISTNMSFLIWPMIKGKYNNFMDIVSGSKLHG